MKIGIIGAMEEELSRLREQLSDSSYEDRGGLRFFFGKLKGREVVLVRSGIGKVNAAACTQLLIDRYAVDCIINTGIAGSLDNRIDIGDIVISEDAVQYDVDATSFGYSPGEVPRVGRLAFPADSGLIALAEEENRRVNREIHGFIGRVCSGDRFVSDSETKQKISEGFQGLCVEMEGAAIAQVAFQSRVPFVIVRAISDKADNSASVDYPIFERQAISHCVRLTEAVVERLA